MLKHNLHDFFSGLPAGRPCGAKNAKSRTFSFYALVVEPVTRGNAYAISGCCSIIGSDRNRSESLPAFGDVYSDCDLARLGEKSQWKL